MRLSRLVLAAAFAAAAATAAPAAAIKDLPDCQRNPQACLDRVGAATGGEVTVTYQPMVVCVTHPCYQPTPVYVCVTSLGYCTPK